MSINLSIDELSKQVNVTVEESTNNVNIELVEPQRLHVEVDPIGIVGSKGDQGIQGIRGIQGAQGEKGASLGESFESVSQNLNSYPYTINRTNGEITSIDYDVEGVTITKKITRENGVITKINILNAPPNIFTCKNLIRDENNNIVEITYTEYAMIITVDTSLIDAGDTPRTVSLISGEFSTENENRIVFWGDGQSTHISGRQTVSHTYDVDGVYTICINDSILTHFNQIDIITTIHQLGYPAQNYKIGSSVTDIYRDNLTSFSSGICYTSHYSNMSYMFSRCRYLSDINFTKYFDTSNVNDMQWMFSYVGQRLFSTSETNNKSLDLSMFDTSSVLYMQYMFYNVKGYGKIILEDFDTSNVISMQSMFANTIDLDNLVLYKWDTSKVTDMSNMFNLYRGNYVYFYDNSNNGNFNTSNVTNMSSMFSNSFNLGSSVFNRIFSSFDTRKVTSASFMFNRCNINTDINLGFNNFTFDACTTMRYMFYQADLNRVFFQPNLNTSNVTDMAFMFNRATISGFFNTQYFSTASLQNAESMFEYIDADASSLRWVEDINVENLTRGVDMFLGETLETSTYDDLLVKWEAQNLQSNVTINFGNSKYTAGGAAEAARQSLIDNYGWIISDGGTA